MDIHLLTVGMLATNGFVIAEDKDAVIIDPGDEPERFEQVLKSGQLRLQAILLTHGHGDHIGAVGELRKRYTGAPVYCHPLDAHMLTDPVKNMALQAGIFLNVGKPDRLLTAGEILIFGELKFEVRHLPGHTPGHVVFVAEDHVFAGDTLFAGGVGRWDLPGGNGRLLFSSIRSQLLSLSDNVTVWPGHGSVTTIGEERRTNPFLNQNIDPDVLGW